MRLEQFLVNEASNNTLMTRLQEGLHCIGFSIYQIKNDLTKELFEDDETFNKAYTLVDIDSGLEELKKFMVDNPSWTDSIIRLVKVVEKSTWLKGKNYKFSRTNGMMDKIYTEFKKLSKQDEIKLNNDKWNPSDIWASKINALPTSFGNLMEYNKFISDMLKSGKLVGISLKKTKGSAKVIFQGPSVKPIVIELGLIQKTNKLFPTGVVINSSDGDVKFQARSFKIAKCSEISVEISLKNAAARSGKVPAKLYQEIVRDNNIDQMTDKRIKQYMDEGETKLKEIILNLWNRASEGNITISETDVDKAWDNDQPEKYMDDICFWKSIIHSLELAAFLRESGSAADDILMSFYINGKSLGELSSDFILAY